MEYNSNIFYNTIPSYFPFLRLFSTFSIWYYLFYKWNLWNCGSVVNCKNQVVKRSFGLRPQDDSVDAAGFR